MERPVLLDEKIMRSEIMGAQRSTLRKAITYGKLVNGVDVCKFGKQWVVSIDSMKREYGPGANR